MVSYFQETKQFWAYVQRNF